MKRLLALTLAAWSGWEAHAQGTFIFSNRIPAYALDQPVLDVGGATKVDGAHFVAAVFLNGVQLGPAAPFRTGAGAGYWNPGENSTRTVTGKFSGEVVSGFSVQVWDSSRGATYAAARAAGGKFGESNPFSITLGGPKADPSLPPDVPAAMVNFQSFAFFTPEPSVLALGAVGATIVLICRRKQPGSTRCPNECKS